MGATAAIIGATIISTAIAADPGPAQNAAKAAADTNKKASDEALAQQQQRDKDLETNRSALANKSAQEKRKGYLTGSRGAGRAGTILTNFGADTFAGNAISNTLSGTTILGG